MLSFVYPLPYRTDSSRANLQVSVSRSSVIFEKRTSDWLGQTTSSLAHLRGFGWNRAVFISLAVPKSWLDPRFGNTWLPGKYSDGITTELGVEGTVASAAGPSAALSGVAGTGVT